MGATNTPAYKVGVVDGRVVRLYSGAHTDQWVRRQASTEAEKYKNATPEQRDQYVIGFVTGFSEQHDLCDRIATRLSLSVDELAIRLIASIPTEQPNPAPTNSDRGDTVEGAASDPETAMDLVVRARRSS